jgi:hypothetical protein
MHIVKSWHFSVLVGLSSILSSGLVFSGWMYIQHINIPMVVVDEGTETCLQVVNFANGDAYNCDDVGVMLRRYRKTYDLPEAAPAETIEATNPVEARKKPQR